MTETVAIQGVEGCFHDAAAHAYFAESHPEMNIATFPCETFRDMMSVMSEREDAFGVMAIENTIAGPLLQNHELLRASKLKIVGEHKARISHVLCALPGQEIHDLSEVHSHPMALMQCEEFLLRHKHMRMVEDFDTAGSAREISANQIAGRAAVCGEYAADMYGLEILERGIETNKHNFTRFLILSSPSREAELLPLEDGLNKASIVFSLPHTRGALSKVLAILSFYEVNLTKIHSTPIVGREWEYRFYVDLTFDSFKRYTQAVEAVRPLISEFQTLGVYSDLPHINPFKKNDNTGPSNFKY